MSSIVSALGWVSLFSFAEYRATCCADEGEENPPKLAERRRVGFGEFRSIPRGLPRGASLAKIMRPVFAPQRFPYLIVLTALWWLGDSVLEFTLPIDFEGRGISLSAIGILLAIPSFFGLVIDLPVGFLANAANRRKSLMAWGLGLSAIGAALIWGWPSLFYLTLGLAVWGVGYQLWKVPRDASLSAETVFKNRGFRFGVDWNVGSLAGFWGPIIAGFILSRLGTGGNYGFYIISTVLVLAGLFLGWPTVQAKAAGSGAPASPPTRLAWPFVKSSALILLIFLMVAAWTQILWSYGPIFIIRPELGLGALASGLVLAAFSLPSILLSAWAGRWADRIDRAWAIALGLAVAGLGTIWFAYAPTLFSLIASALLAALGLTLALPAATADLFDRAISGQRGALSGLWNFSMDIGYVVGPLLGALLVGLVSFQSIFVVSGGLFILLAAATVLGRFFHQASRVS